MGMFATKLTLKGRAPLDPAPKGFDGGREAPRPGAGAAYSPAEARGLSSDRAALPVERFWFVWSPTELCPKRRHPTVEGAVIEAERLGRFAPEKEFLVYEARLVGDHEGEQQP
jgi:hypothetical protein